jgi:hypothetical protein
LDVLTDYIIARAHIDGFSLVRNAGKTRDGSLFKTYLQCSQRGQGITFDRTSFKCDCKFELRLNTLITGSVNTNVISLDHNHNPTLSEQRGDGKVNLKFFQKHLLMEDEVEIFKSHPDVEVQRKEMARIITKRYLEIFNKFSDGEAALIFKKVCILGKYLI